MQSKLEELDDCLVRGKCVRVHRIDKNVFRGLIPPSIKWQEPLDPVGEGSPVVKDLK